MISYEGTNVCKLQKYCQRNTFEVSENDIDDGVDVDIAFISDIETSDYEIFMLAQKLADILKKDVDLIDLKKASTVFKVQVIAKGEHIYCSDNKEGLILKCMHYSIILNIQRACKASVDLAMHIVSEKKLGIPQNSRDAFEVLFQNNIIDKELMNNLKSMVGFRNIAVRDYQTVSLSIVKEIIEKHIYDLKKFAEHMLQFYSK